MITLKLLRAENFKLLRQVEVVFPPRGSVLVEGLNESGKSTLFESVFFGLYGVPLLTEGRGKGNLESAIRYGADSAQVVLQLEVEDTQMEVRRTLTRGKPSQARLLVRRPGAPEERVAGVQAVNARVVDELGGLDGEALLNSCFVEQKKLSKLEDLAIGQRKESLRRLLNLERLTTLADRFRVTPQDERALARARDRLELAEVAALLPKVVAERAGVEAPLTHVPLHGQTAARREMEEERAGEGGAELVERLEGLRGRRFALRRRGLVLAATAAVGVLLAVALLAAGVHGGVWGLPAAVVPAVLSALTFRALSDLGRQAADLEFRLALRRDLLVAKIGELESRNRRLEDVLGVDGTSLRLGECRVEVEGLARQLEVKRRAAEIIEGTMERIVRMVLPNTERNLGQILPLLTAGRYHEARIGDDYQIQVWDDSAGRYVSKGIFSGGARDQFSLALRLAFALATLPQELGTTPGFIFLDEPLSSFDGPRTEALVQLLTAGQVAANFSQIFVISHNRSFDLAAFQYRLVMRDGRVVESNLPASPTPAPPR